MLKRLDGATEISIWYFDQISDYREAEGGRPDDVFIGMLYEIAALNGLTREFRLALDMASKTICNKNEETWLN